MLIGIRLYVFINLTLTDLVEALASDRPYRSTLGIEAALDKIKTTRGILEDKDTVYKYGKILKRNIIG
jgi:hypothetical protein